MFSETALTVISLDTWCAYPGRIFLLCVSSSYLNQNSLSYQQNECYLPGINKNSGLCLRIRVPIIQSCEVFLLLVGLRIWRQSILLNREVLRWASSLRTYLWVLIFRRIGGMWRPGMRMISYLAIRLMKDSHLQPALSIQPRWRFQDIDHRGASQNYRIGERNLAFMGIRGISKIQLDIDTREAPVVGASSSLIVVRAYSHWIRAISLAPFLVQAIPLSNPNHLWN